VSWGVGTRHSGSILIPVTQNMGARDRRAAMKGGEEVRSYSPGDFLGELGLLKQIGASTNRAGLAQIVGLEKLQAPDGESLGRVAQFRPTLCNLC
jgi:hypothetical protein